VGATSRAPFARHAEPDISRIPKWGWNVPDQHRIEAHINDQLRLATEKLYGDERLRSRLNDVDSQSLLSWGERCLDAAAQEAKRAANDRASSAIFEGAALRIRAAIAGVNDLIGDKPRLSDSQLRRALAGLVLHAQKQTTQVTTLVDELIATHQKLDNQEFIQRLTKLIELSWRSGGTTL
jgi:hypothetical protein